MACRKGILKCHITYNGNNNIASLKWPTDNLLIFFNLQEFFDFHPTNDVVVTSEKVK